MATVPVDVAILVKGQNKLDKLQKQVDRLDKEFAAIQRRVPGAANSIRNFGRSSQQASRGVNSLVRGIGKLAIAYGTVAAAQSALQTGITRIESERRIRFLAREYGEVAELTEAANRAVQKFGVSQNEANKALADTYARLRPVGVQLSDIESVYTGFNTAARLSGASAVEASQAFRQLAQALGSGALRGDEFNSISEQVPGILTAIAKETGVAQGELREYAAEGKLTADIVIRALKRIEKEGADQLAEALDGPTQKIKAFQNATEEVQVALTRTVIPELTASLTELGNVILALEGPIRYIGGLLADALGAANDLIGLVAPGTSGTAKAIKAGRLPLENNLGILGRGQGSRELFKDTITPFGVGLDGLKKEAYVAAETTGKTYSEALVATMQKYLEANDAAGVMAKAFAGGQGGLKPVFKPTPLGSDKAAKERAKRLAEEAKKALEAQKAYQGIASAVLDGNIALKERVAEQTRLSELLKSGFTEEAARKIIERERERQELLAQRVRDLARVQGIENLSDQQKADMAKAINALYDQRGVKLEENFQMEDRITQQMREQTRVQQELNFAQETMNGLVNDLGRQFSSLFDTLINGTNSWQQALAGALRQMSSLLLNAGIKGLGGGDGKGFFSFLGGDIAGPSPTALPTETFSKIGPGSALGKAFETFQKRANGGPVSGGTPYVVGERGPELFVPGSNGGIVPNNALGGGGDVQIVQNFYVGGNGSDSTSASGKGQKEEMVLLARMMETTALGVINRERRPGGVLSR